MADDPLGLARLPKVKVPAAETPRPEALLGLATGVVVVSALYLARDVLIPITLAIFLSFFLAPSVKQLQRARLPKVAAVIVAVVVALAVILLVGAIIGSQIKALIGNLPQYLSTVNDKIELVHRVMNSLVSQVDQSSRYAARTPDSGARLVRQRRAGTAADAGRHRIYFDQLPRNRPRDFGANSLSPRNPRDRSHRHDIHPRPAGGSSGSADTPVRL